MRQPAVPHDRHPELDKRIRMSTAAISEHFEKKKYTTVPIQRPVIDGWQCAAPLVDCRGVEKFKPEHTGGASRGEHAGAIAAPSSTTDANGTAKPADVADNRSAHATQPGKPIVLPLRLAAGHRAKEGRLEVLFQGIWGTVCSEGWDWPAAHVACRTLGFGGVDALSMTADYGLGRNQIWLSHVRCNGDEPGLGHCKFYGLNRSTIPPKCSHEYDVGLVCSTEKRSIPASMFASEEPPLRTPRTAGLDFGARDEREGSGPDAIHSETTSAAEAVTSSTVRPNGDSCNCPDADRCFPPPTDLGSALDMLEEVTVRLEQRRPVIDDIDLARLTRLRLRLRRLAGKPEDSADACARAAGPAGEDAIANSSVPRQGTMKMNDPTSVEAASSAEIDEEDYGISRELASRLPTEMLEELKRTPRKRKSLAESKAEFEERRRQEAFDPLANDPVEQALRDKADHYVPPDMRSKPLRERGSHETLRKPPIQNLVNRRPPSWEESYKWRYEHTMEQIRLGLAPEGIMRTLGPGPWDNDAGFWRDSGDPDVILDHEMDEDIHFDRLS